MNLNLISSLLKENIQPYNSKKFTYLNAHGLPCDKLESIMIN